MNVSPGESDVTVSDMMLVSGSWDVVIVPENSVSPIASSTVRRIASLSSRYWNASVRLFTVSIFVKTVEVTDPLLVTKKVAVDEYSSL